MHQTTVRFTPELWRRLEAEAARLGVSVAQYLRDIALMRLAHDAGRAGSGDGRRPEPPPALHLDGAAARARHEAEAAVQGSAALWAQAELARSRAQHLRAVAAARRRDAEWSGPQNARARGLPAS